MVRQVGPSNAKWHVRAAGDFTMTSQRKSELEAVNRRVARNDPRYRSPARETQAPGARGARPMRTRATCVCVCMRTPAVARCPATDRSVWACSRLVELTLAWTACGDWGVEAISDCLKINTVITELDLYHNDVGPRGASALARALRKNYTLNIINLDMNNIGDEGVQEFIDTLHGHNTSLTKLKVANNHVNPVQLRDLNVLLEHNEALKVDLDWHKVQNKILPLKYERGEIETKRSYLQGLKEAEDPQVIEQIEDCTDQIEVIDKKVHELLKTEDKLLEDGTWLKRKFDKLRSTVLTYMGVHKAVNRLRAKAEQHGPTIEEERNAINEQLSELQGRFLSPEANKWKPEYKREMEAKLRELQLKQTQVRSKERAMVAKMQLEKQIKLQEAQQLKEQLTKGDEDDMNRFKPKTVSSRFEVPPGASRVMDRALCVVHAREGGC